MSGGASDWRAAAACAGGDDEWFPAPRARVNPLVLRVCGHCPVWRECLLFALAHPDIWHGVWAGLTARELAALRARLLRGELGTDVVEQARRISDSRGRVTIYRTAVPHPVPSYRELRRQYRHVLVRLHSLGLVEHGTPTGEAA